MKKYFWVGLLFVAHSAFAIFEDEEARKKAVKRKMTGKMLTNGGH